MGTTPRTAREEELQIEIERLKCWLHKIQCQAHFETPHGVLEVLAEKAIQYNSCAVQPEWGGFENWAKLGLWPPYSVGTDPEAIDWHSRPPAPENHTDAPTTP